MLQQEPCSGAGQVPFWELSMLIALFGGGCAHVALLGCRLGWWVLVPSSGGISLCLTSSVASAVACPLT